MVHISLPPLIVPIFIVLYGTSNKLHVSFLKLLFNFSTSFKNKIEFSLLDSFGIGVLE
ncbi:MAG: hypothetical protein L6V81_11755 [Clostridium sp.]|nr:MAG: hypothetical protein L6V81_11755 [Clostridium sp.]